VCSGSFVTLYVELNTPGGSSGAGILRGNPPLGLARGLLMNLAISRKEKSLGGVWGILVERESSSRGPTARVIWVQVPELEKAIKSNKNGYDLKECFTRRRETPRGSLISPINGGKNQKRGRGQ